MRALALVLSALVTAGLVSSECINGPTTRDCWDGDYGTFNITTDYYKNTPNTGRIVEVRIQLTNLM